MKHIILVFSFYVTSCFPTDWDFLSVDGYGAVGGAYQNNDEVLYRNSIHTAQGSQDDFSFTNYTNLGLQLDISLMNNLNFIIQGTMSDSNEKGSLVELGWANLNYQVNDSLNLKIGKMRIPAFMYSDVLNVSYAYDWVKLPEMYSIIPFQNYNGVELNYDYGFDDLSIISTMRFGKSKSMVINGSQQESDLVLEQMKGLALKLVSENLTFRFAYNQNHFKVKSQSLDRLILQLTSLGIPSISNAVNKYTPKEIKYWEFGGRYDFENVYLVGEYMEIRSNSFLANNTSWYGGLGYDFDNWSPFFLYSRTSSSSNYQDIAINNRMPSQVIATIMTTNQILGSIYKVNSIESETKSLGLRYDLYKNTVIKFQYDHHKELKDEGLNINFAPNKDVDLHVFSTAINFVF